MRRATSVATLSGASANFTGTTRITAGTIKLGAGNALGTNAVTVSPGGALDFGGQNLGSQSIIAAGTGPGTSGALINTGADQTQTISNAASHQEANRDSSCRFSWARARRTRSALLVPWRSRCPSVLFTSIRALPRFC